MHCARNIKICLRKIWCAPRLYELFCTRLRNRFARNSAVNAEISGDEIIYKNYVNMGIAVGTEKGLVVPVLRDVQDMGLAQIEQTIGDFGRKARDGKLAIEDLQVAHLPYRMAGFTAPSCRHQY